MIFTFAAPRVPVRLDPAHYQRSLIADQPLIAGLVAFFLFATLIHFCFSPLFRDVLSRSFCGLGL
jgi:hypothetical protein